VNAYQRIFGRGPLGAALSLGLLFLALLVAREMPQGWLVIPHSVKLIALNAGALGAFALIYWSTRTLNVKDRGRKLCTTGPFRYVRHPLYASFLSWFNFGLAIYIGHIAFILWALLLHPVWWLVIRKEEAAMSEEFGQEWSDYAKRTGCFVPRLRTLLGR